MMHDGTISEITGTETRAKDGSPLDALIEFYRAFNAGDLDALAANWADGDAPSMGPKQSHVPRAVIDTYNSNNTTNKDLLVEGKGFEPSTSALRTPRSPN